MTFRAGCLAALVCFAPFPARVAFADWKVHRSPQEISQQVARVFSTHPERDGLASRLVRGRSRAEVEALLRRFEGAAEKDRSDRDAQLAYAQLLLAARRWEDAAARFELAAELSPTDATARRGKARALNGAGKISAAVTEFRSALLLARQPTDVSRLARELVSVALAAGDLEAEVEGRRARVRVQPGERVLLELAATLSSAGRHGEAAGVLVEGAGFADRTPGKRARWDLAEGKYWATGGELDNAASAFDRARRQAPAREFALRRLIWDALIENSRRKGTLVDVKRELSQPRDFVEWVARARISDELGDLRGAWQAFDEAIRLSPRDLDLRLRQISVARRVGSSHEVAQLYEAFTGMAVANAAPPAVLIEALDGLWQLGRPDIAKPVFDKVLARGRNDSGLLRALAELAGGWGDHRRAERCWMGYLRNRPRDEIAVVALGEIQLQRGQRRSALETWRSVVRGSGRTRADGHARYAEILADHDFLTQALDQARAAMALLTNEPRYHRLTASILDRQARLLEAESEWETVLRLARGPSGAGDRNEARSRLVALWVRGGERRLQAKLRAMEDTLARDNDDRETLMFLIQAQLRTGRAEAAIAKMKGALVALVPGTDGHLGESRGSAPSPGRPPDQVAEISDADAEVILVLVRTLRQVDRREEAMSWLEILSRGDPTRARDARLQLADMALAGHADRRAQDYAELAATTGPVEVRVVLRAAAVQERLGHFHQAAGMYRRVLDAPPRDSAVVLALAALLSRSGEIDEQRALLREVLRNGADEEVIASAAARAIALEEASGTLAALEAYVADTPGLNGQAPGATARRRVLAAILWRLVPSAYRDKGRDPGAAAKLESYAQHGMRPLLDLVDAPDAAPDLRAIELLGMLGRAEGVPALTRLLVPDVVPGEAVQSSSSRAPSRDELMAVLVIALGRLGGEQARIALEATARQSAPSLRLPLLWALGRVGGPVAIRLAHAEMAGQGQNGVDGSVIACLALGRAGGPDASSYLATVAEDPLRPTPVRTASLLALGLGPHSAALPVLRRLARSADRRIAESAAISVGRFGQGESAEDPAGAGREEGGLDCRRLSPDDDAVAIKGGYVDAEALLQALRGCSAPASSWSAASATTGLLPPARAGQEVTARLDLLPAAAKNAQPTSPISGQRNESVHGDERR